MASFLTMDAGFLQVLLIALLWAGALLLALWPTLYSMRAMGTIQRLHSARCYVVLVALVLLVETRMDGWDLHGFLLVILAVLAFIGIVELIGARFSPRRGSYASAVDRRTSADTSAGASGGSSGDHPMAAYRPLMFLTPVAGVPVHQTFVFLRVFFAVAFFAGYVIIYGLLRGVAGFCVPSSVIAWAWRS